MTTNTQRYAIAQLKQAGYDAVPCEKNELYVLVQDPVLVLGTDGQPDRTEYKTHRLLCNSLWTFLDQRK